MIDTATKNSLLGYLLGKTTYTPPATWYLGVSTTDIKADGSGFTEPAAASGYARFSIPNSTASFNSPSNGVVTNKNEIMMNRLTVDCGTATNIFLSDTATGGKARVWYKLKSNETLRLQVRSTVYFEAGDLKFSVLNDSAIFTNTALKNSLSGYLLGKTAYTPPATWYFGVSTTDIQAAGTGFTEPATSAGYARVAIPNSTASFNTPASGAVTNKIKIQTPTLSTDCGTGTNLFLSDSATGGAARIWQKLTGSDQRILSQRSRIDIYAGDLKLSLVDADG